MTLRVANKLTNQKSPICCRSDPTACAEGGGAQLLLPLPTEQPVPLCCSSPSPAPASSPHHPPLTRPSSSLEAAGRSLLVLEGFLLVDAARMFPIG
jgi:hypothetical protein